MNVLTIISFLHSFFTLVVVILRAMARFRPVSNVKTVGGGRGYAGGNVRPTVVHATAILNYSVGITTALTGSLTFPTPPVSIADQTAANSALSAAIAAFGTVGNRGSKAQHIAMIDAAKVVQENLINVGGYVNGISAGSEALILSAGFQASSPKSNFGILPAPQNLRSPYSKHTRTGETRLRWKKVKGASAYNIYSSGTDATLPMVQIASAKKTLYVRPGGASGVLQYYKVSCVGAAGEGPMSDILAAAPSF